MSYSTCVINCDRCGNHADVDLSSGLCTKCRVEQRRAEDVAYPPGSDSMIERFKNHPGYKEEYERLNK